MTYPSVYILRHGQTVWNKQHRVQGRLDSSLTALGQRQVGQQRQILQGQNLVGFTAFSSPQGRAFHSAALALVGLVPSIHTDARLCEIGVGDWEGARRSDICPDGMEDESEEGALSLYERAPGGEGFEALRIRCRAFLDDLTGPSVLMTHGITSRMLRLLLLDMDTCEIGSLPGGQGVVFHVADGVQTKLQIGA